MYFRMNFTSGVFSSKTLSPGGCSRICDFSPCAISRNLTGLSIQIIEGCMQLQKTSKIEFFSRAIKLYFNRFLYAFYFKSPL